MSSSTTQSVDPSSTRAASLPFAVFPRAWPKSVARIVEDAVRAAQVANGLLPVRPQASEQALEERFASRQACCSVGCSFGHEPLRLPVFVSRGCYPWTSSAPASGGLIVQLAGRDGRGQTAPGQWDHRQIIACSI
jgi:hypothetical protein